MSWWVDNIVSWWVCELLVFREFISKRADLFCTTYMRGVSVVCWQHNNKPLSIYRNIKVKTVSISNHNWPHAATWWRHVVLYRFSTSNHNRKCAGRKKLGVVLYRFSTSNHNPWTKRTQSVQLYYIVSLHQTTTEKQVAQQDKGCIISFLYIKPQPFMLNWKNISVVLYRFSTSNHNFLW